MGTYHWQSVKVVVDRERLATWLLQAIEREETHLAEREAELTKAIGNPEIAQTMIERLAVGYGQSAAGLASHEQQEIAALAKRVAEVRSEIETMEHYLVGLRHALNKDVEITLGLVHELAPKQ
jgi:hypothetical protein